MKNLLMLLAIGALGVTLSSCGGVLYDDGFYGSDVGFFGGGGGGWGGHGHHGGHFGGHGGHGGHR